MQNKVIIIAEAGVNHNGDINKAFRLVDAAKEANVDYVKFQTFKAEKLVTKTAKKAEYQTRNTEKSDSQFDMLRQLELSEKNQEKLISYCEKKKIKFLSTAFDLDSIDFLSNKLDFYKIPSGEITNFPYLVKVASLNLPVVLSTGMANLNEVKDALNVLVSKGLNKSDITILHCNTEYPTPMEDVNLKAMQNIQNELGVTVGYSDHTLGIEIPIAAVAMGAKVIEKHFTLDNNLPGPDHKASLEPEELKAMVIAIRNIEKAIAGNGIKEPSLSEKKNIEIARKSIHLIKSYKKGEFIKEKDMIALRPGNGISPMKWNSIIGRKLNVDTLPYHQLSSKDLL